MSKHEMNLTEGALVPKIIKYAIPIVLSSILQLTFNAADLIVVGQFAGEGSVGAVGATGSVTNLIVTLLVGLSVGSCSVIAKFIGAGDRDSASRTAHTSIVIAVLGGVVIGVFGFFMSRTFLEMMGTPAEIIDRSTIYMKIYFIGFPANMLYNFGSSIMRAMGDTKRPLYYLTVAGATNVVLNLVLVIVFEMGVAGVAVATAVSQLISAVFVMRALFVTECTCQLSMAKMRVHVRELGSVLRIGIPSGLQSSLFSIANVILQSSVNSFGQYATDGAAASGNIEGYIQISVTALSQATLAFVSQNAGAKKPERVKRTVAWSCVLVFAMCLTLGSLALLFKEQLLSLYLGDSREAIAFGVRRANVVFMGYAFCGVMHVFTSALRGLGWSVLPMVMALMGSCVLRIVWIYTVFAANRTFEILYTCYPLSWLATALALLVVFLFAYRRFARETVKA